MVPNRAKHHKHSIYQVTPWLFALNNFRSAWWLSIPLYDMEILDQTDPELCYQFLSNGNFVAQTVLENNEYHRYFHNRKDSKTFQLRFQRRIDNLKKEFKQHGNPFNVTEDYSDLTRLGTRDAMPENCN